MSRTKLPARRRLTVLLSLFGLWLGAATVVLAVAARSPAFRGSSRIGIWLSGLVGVLFVLCSVALLLLARATHGPASPGAIAGAALSIASVAAMDGALPETEPNASDRLQIILDHLPSSFVLMDADRRILSASANFERVTGRRLDQIVGRHCARGMWSDGFCVGCPSEVAGRTGRPEREVVRLQRPDGMPRYLEHLSVPIRNDGAPSSILEVVTDITDRKSLQDGMARAEKLALAGEMASVVTHEMRNSLTSVKMILQLIQEAGEGEAASEELVGVALGSIQHAEGVLNEMLQFAGPAPPQSQDFDPVSMVRDAAALVRPHLDERRIELLVAADDLPISRGDPEQLKTALFNLLLNACQAVEPGGKIVLRCRRERLAADQRGRIPPGSREYMAVDGRGGAPPDSSIPPNELSVALAGAPETLILEVEDSGPGVPDGLLDRIFDPFFTTKATGTGLGLPMVKRITDAHGGTVTLCNLHPGLRVSISLPPAREDLS